MEKAVCFFKEFSKCSASWLNSRKRERCTFNCFAKLQSLTRTSVFFFSFFIFHPFTFSSFSRSLFQFSSSIPIRDSIICFSSKNLRLLPYIYYLSFYLSISRYLFSYLASILNLFWFLSTYIYFSHFFLAFTSHF